MLFRHLRRKLSIFVSSFIVIPPLPLSNVYHFFAVPLQTQNPPVPQIISTIECWKQITGLLSRTTNSFRTSSVHQVFALASFYRLKSVVHHVWYSTPTIGQFLNVYVKYLRVVFPSINENMRLNHRIFFNKLCHVSRCVAWRKTDSIILRLQSIQRWQLSYLIFVHVTLSVGPRYILYIIFENKKNNFQYWFMAKWPLFS